MGSEGQEAETLPIFFLITEVKKGAGMLSPGGATEAPSPRLPAGLWEEEEESVTEPRSKALPYNWCFGRKEIIQGGKFWN